MTEIRWGRGAWMEHDCNGCKFADLSLGLDEIKGVM